MSANLILILTQTILQVVIHLLEHHLMVCSQVVHLVDNNHVIPGRLAGSIDRRTPWLHDGDMTGAVKSDERGL